MRTECPGPHMVPVINGVACHGNGRSIVNATAVASESLIRSLQVAGSLGHLRCPEDLLTKRLPRKVSGLHRRAGLPRNTQIGRHRAHGSISAQKSARLGRRTSHGILTVCSGLLASDNSTPYRICVFTMREGRAARRWRWTNCGQWPPAPMPMPMPNRSPLGHSPGSK